jgi:hypothetical protein
MANNKNAAHPIGQVSPAIEQAAPAGWASRRVDNGEFGSWLHASKEAAERHSANNGPAAPKYEHVPVYAAPAAVSPADATGKATDLTDAEFLSKRLARVARAAGVKIPEGPHEFIAGVAGTILGEIARKLESATGKADDASAGGAEPEGWREFIENIATPYSEPVNSMVAYRDLASRQEHMRDLRAAAAALLTSHSPATSASAAMDATHEAIQRACRDLPDDYEISIELERGSGCVMWHERGGDWNAIEGEGYLCDDIHKAIDSAMAASRKGTK